MMATSTVLTRSFVQTVAGLPSLQGAKNGTNTGTTNTLGAMKLRSPARRRVVVFANQDTNTLLHKHQGRHPPPKTKDEPLRIFEGSPVEKFFRPEEARRPEDGNKDASNLMKFDGPAPETINSRLVMLGITWAIVAEILTGQSLVPQVTEGRGLIWFLFVSPIIIDATLIPMVNKGESPDSRKAGPFDAQNERWNGRAAMIGSIARLVDWVFLKGPLLGFIHSSLN